MELPLEGWLRTILKIANAPDEPTAPVRRLRDTLRRLLATVDAEWGDAHSVKPLPLRRFRRSLPPPLISVGRTGVRLSSDLNPQTESEVEEANEVGVFAWTAARYADELEAVIYALSADPLGRLVRQCDHCDRFFPGRRKHRRSHQFCCDQHRHAFRRKNRDKAEWAKYMQKNRRDRKRAEVRKQEEEADRQRAARQRALQQLQSRSHR